MYIHMDLWVYIWLDNGYTVDIHKRGGKPQNSPLSLPKGNDHVNHI